MTALENSARFCEIYHKNQGPLIGEPVGLPVDAMLCVHGTEHYISVNAASYSRCVPRKGILAEGDGDFNRGVLKIARDAYQVGVRIQRAKQ